MLNDWHIVQIHSAIYCCLKIATHEGDGGQSMYIHYRGTGRGNACLNRIGESVAVVNA